jgi:putative sterol carrier protein
MFFEQGDLARLEFFDKDQAFGQADYVLGATPQEWKRLLRKKGKFVTDFMLGKVSLEHGSKVGVLSVAPHANTIVDALTQVELQFPDEMSAQELDTYRTKVKAFREELAV